MGDNGQLYVPKELVPIYRESVIRLASIITPNLFETEQLSGITIKETDDVWKAIDVLHCKGCETVIISSADIPEKPDLLSIFASRKKGVSHEKYIMEIKKLPVAFTGSGDLFASLILSWMHKTENDLKLSLENTVASLQSVLVRTIEAMQGKENTVRNRELKLLQSKKDIEEPKVIYKAKVVE
ncbi:unnamed protein product [Psylliodes chrysocephalus]|uniref:Pyridoxal kinase n=1 Tax=Psylliodes chrysocephalus TaxID=3402493 RepID=A0A9P0GHY6_9CUCU|nr:unnamed protein product [Psylliodes chrysocephala]